MEGFQYFAVAMLITFGIMSISYLNIIFGKRCPINPKRPRKHKLKLLLLRFTLTGDLKLDYECKFCRKEFTDRIDKDNILMMLQKKFNVPKKNVLYVYDWLDNKSLITAEDFLAKLVELEKGN